MAVLSVFSFIYHAVEVLTVITDWKQCSVESIVTLHLVFYVPTAAKLIINIKK